MEKIYKITDDKKNDIIGILNVDYESYKYSALQGQLDKINIKIKNGVK